MNVGHIIDENLMSLNLHCHDKGGDNSLLGSALATIKSHIIEFLDHFTSFTSYLHQVSCTLTLNVLHTLSSLFVYVHIYLSILTV